MPISWHRLEMLINLIWRNGEKFTEVDIVQLSLEECIKTQDFLHSVLLNSNSGTDWNQNLDEIISQFYKKVFLSQEINRLFKLFAYFVVTVWLH